jgi:hypothetical protein
MKHLLTTLLLSCALSVLAVTPTGLGLSNVATVAAATSAPSGPTDPDFASVVALLHLDGSDGSTTITDVKGNTCAASGGATISTAQSKFGGASLLLDGTNDHVQITSPGSAFDLGSSNWTFDWWFRSADVATSTPRTLWSWRNTGAANNTQLAAQVRSNSIRVTVSFDGATDNTFAAFGTAAMSISNNTWHFCRMVRNGADYRLFIDGVQRGSTYTPAGNPSFSNLSRDCWIGRNNATYFPGYIDDFRVTIGVARDGSEVPTAAFPDA